MKSSYLAFCAAILCCCTLSAPASAAGSETEGEVRAPRTEKRSSKQRQKAGKAERRKKKAKKGVVDDRAYYGA